MSLRTMSLTIALRNLARRLGLTRPIALWLGGRAYEEAFDRALMSSIRPGDVVWDVGANLGLYSRKFAEAVGEAGRVYAFEPSPPTVARLRAEVGADPRISIVTKGLGSDRGRMRMVQGEDSLGATSRIVDEESEAAMIVDVDTGDHLVASGEAAAPNVVKIDVEGYEPDVLAGMQGLLAEPTLRAVCVEVHFQLLNERGQPGAPASMEKQVRAAGFKLRWTDSSHFVASRA